MDFTCFCGTISSVTCTENYYIEHATEDLNSFDLFPPPPYPLSFLVWSLTSL
jgi:hypothetical protein